MPEIATWVPETYECITRPVAIGIVRDLAKKLGMSPDLRINFPGLSEAVAQAGSNLTNNPMGNNYWPNSDKIFMEVTETSRDANALATPVFRPDNPPVFHDPRVHTLIRPIYDPTEMVLSLRYRAPDRVTAERWRDDIITRYHRGRVEMLHEVTYSYQIPYAFIEILSAISTMKEAVAPYGEALIDWVRTYISPKATTIVGLDGRNPVLSIGETQQKVIGWFDFEFTPENPQKDNDLGACTVSFQYHIDYDKVVQCAMSYPLVVHNQLISSRYRDTNRPYLLADQKVEPSLTTSYFEKIVPGMRQRYLPTIPWVRIPSYDSWNIPTGRKTLSPLMSIMTQVDTTDSSKLINLGQLGDYTVDPDIMAFLAGEGPYLDTFGQSVFHFTLFEESTPLPDGHMTWQSTYDLYFDQPLDLRERYHLVWSVVNDLSLLTRDALVRLGNHSAAALKILAAIGNGTDPCIRLIPLPKPINGMLYPEQFLKYAAAINACRARGRGVLSNTTLPLTLGNFLLNAVPATATT